MSQAIVTDLRYRMALAPVRTLKRAGYQVTGVELSTTSERRAICFASKALSDRRFLPAGDGFIQALAQLCREKSEMGEKPVLLPVGRGTLELVRDSPELAEAADFLVPGAESMALADDKWELNKLASSLGIPTPRTLCRTQFGSLEELAYSSSYPAFIKFRNGELLGLKPVDRYRVVRTPEELMAVYPQMEAVDSSPIVQASVPGHDIGIAVLMGRDGRLVDHLCYESLREYPATGGPTCLCRTVESRNLVLYAKTLLQALSFRGIAMLDFRGSLENPLLLEVNPRVWGSANLCDVADSSFFPSYAREAHGECCADTHTGYRVGAVMRFSPQNMASFFSRLQNGAPFLHTAADYLRTAFDPHIKDGFNISGDRGPYRRYLLNLLSRS